MEPASGGVAPEWVEKRKERQEAVAEVLFRKDDDGHFVALWPNVSDVARILLEEGVDLTSPFGRISATPPNWGAITCPDVGDLTTARMQVPGHAA